MKPGTLGVAVKGTAVSFKQYFWFCTIGVVVGGLAATVIVNAK